MAQRSTRTSRLPSSFHFHSASPPVGSLRPLTKPSSTRSSAAERSGGQSAVREFGRLALAPFAGHGFELRHCGSGTGMRSGYVHVATPYPSKLVKKTPSVLDRPKQPAGYACSWCSRTFYSYIALKTHCKVKKHKRSPHK